MFSVVSILSLVRDLVLDIFKTLLIHDLVYLSCVGAFLLR